VPATPSTELSNKMKIKTVILVSLLISGNHSIPIHPGNLTDPIRIFDAIALVPYHGSGGLRGLSMLEVDAVGKQWVWPAEEARQDAYAET
jgi:hypothetical protein